MFITVGRAYTVAALLQFFGIETIDDSPNHNFLPNDVIHGDGDKKLYFDNALDKFVSEYLMPSSHAIDLDQSLDNQQLDLVREYSFCLLRLFFILADVKRAVKMGNGDRLASLHKVLSKHFKSDAGHNIYAIEMLISILQDEVSLTEAQAHQTRWASTANFKGGLNNLEIDLLQENLNRELKKGIKGMGANKTPKAIERLSMAAGGTMEIVKKFDSAMGIKAKSASHSHKSSQKDKKIVISYLLSLKPLPDVSSDTLHTLHYDAFHEWLKRDKKIYLNMDR